jgi:hypothetical protein
MQTIVGQFADPTAADAADHALRAYRIGRPQATVKATNPMVERIWSSGLKWDAMAQLAIVAGIILGAFFGLLAGAGVFGMRGHVTGASIVAGIFVGISIGMVVGFTVGGFVGAFIPDPLKFLPQRLQDHRLVLAVQTEDRLAPEAFALMQRAHATNVTSLPGVVPLNAIVAELPPVKKAA